jgi:NAD(P)H dehydrogenase (quinone)
MGSVNLSVIYYSSTGTIHALAAAMEEAATAAGATVRLRRVAETAPRAAIDSNPAWAGYVDSTTDVEQATLDDLQWADATIFGTPTRFGNVAAQLKQFLDTAGGLWQQGGLAGKVYSSFTSTGTVHGGHESTILALNNTFYHWGGIIVPPGYTDAVQFRTGNPYGASAVAGAGAPSEDVLESARHQARWVVSIAGALRTGRAQG